MKSRSSWLTALSASVVLFVGQRLNTVGEVIARELERSYASATGHEISSAKKVWRFRVGLLRLTGWHHDRSK